ncbi:MAG TPA: hypothetical protein DD713_04445 [Nitrospiraceae bacterium]|nr:hypothetical protein [Nitrospiraceae bacterium]
MGLGYYVYCGIGRLAVLAVILDLYSRQIVGWAMSDRMTAGFVIKALYQAIWRRPASECILHSDKSVFEYIEMLALVWKNWTET